MAPVDDVPARLDFDDCEPHEFAVGDAEAGQRLDVYLAPRLEGLYGKLRT